MRILHSCLLLVFAGLARQGAAENICNETVPANRHVDGIPAYSQCTASGSSSIYSNDGINTSTTASGADWIRTQGSYGYQCTEFAHRYLIFRWNVQGVPNGNAGTWCTNPAPAGLVKTAVPVHGDIIVFPPGSCGASSTTGHVAVVDTVLSSTSVTIVEQNVASRRTCAISCADCFLHAVANTGIDNISGLSTGRGISVKAQGFGGRITLRLEGPVQPGATVRIFDLGGRVLAVLPARSGLTAYDASGFPAGVLVASVRSRGREYASRMVLVK